ncbi:MAG: TetR family transcriptional regulator [Deltaproteobacteria bacterium]|nr:TetR family transcriptional regulator [Deltaproteobacteria bacterium]
MNVHSRKSRAADGRARGRGRPVTGGKSTAILDAALALFAERGYHGTAIPEIASAAGVAAGTIYRHFASKDELVNAVYRRAKQQLMAQVLDGLPGPGAVREQFHELWQRLRAFAHAEPIAFAFLELHHHADYLDHESRTLELQALLPVAKFLEAAAAAGHVRAIPPQALMAMVWGAFIGLIKAQRTGYLRFTDDLSAQTCATLWDAIRAPSHTLEPRP